jgi:hypothetical protein
MATEPAHYAEVACDTLGDFKETVAILSGPGASVARAGAHMGIENNASSVPNFYARDFIDG